MFSKRLTLLALPLLLTGCSLGFNEEVVKPKITVNPVQSGCLANGGDVMSRYFDGKVEDAEVDAFGACLEKAITTFTNNTRGASADYFTGEELSGFLTKYFLKGKTINPAFVKEVMLLKQGMLGGDANKITQDELKQVLKIFSTLRRVSLRLRPIMPINVNSFVQRNYTAEQFETAMTEFQEGLGEIGKTLEETQGSYSMDSLKNLLTEMRSFLYPEATDNKVWLDTAIRWTSALRPAKYIFIAPPKDEIQAADWAKIYFLAPKYYALYLKVMFYVKSNNENYLSGTGLVHLEKLFSDAIELFEKVLDNHPGGVIQSAEIGDLLTALHDNDMLPVPVETVQAFIRTLFGRLFAAPTLTDSYTITKANLDRLKETFRFGTEGLRAIDAIYAGRAETLSAEEINKITTDTLIGSTALRNDISREAIESVKHGATAVRTVFPKNFVTVYIPKKEPLFELSASHLAKVHLLQSVNRLLVQAYGAKKDSLSEKEVNVLADDIFPILQAVGLVGEETRKSVPKRLMEASLFLYSSDGDTSLTMTEATELETLLLSTVIRGGKLHKEIAAYCNATAKDARGKLLIPAKCYRDTFLQGEKSTWAYIPGLAEYFTGKKKEEQMKLFLKMEKFLRKDRGDQDFNMGDTYSFILLPYYVELLFSRFDADRNGFLDNAEAEKAYVVFKPFLAAKAAAFGLTSDEDLHGVYMFLLGYQELPNNMKITWVWRRYITGAASFKVDRGQVIQIFEKLMAPPAAPAK